MDYHGWYRGIALSAPDTSGRIEVRIPMLTGADSAGLAWPFDRRDTVAVGEGVWVMFEAGDLRHPVWAGRWIDG